MSYKLPTSEKNKKGTVRMAFHMFAPLVAGEKKSMIIALVSVLVNSATNLIGPYIIAYIVDTSIQAHDFHGVLIFSAVLLGVYLVGLVGSYVQTITMGSMGRRVLFNLRNAVFNKIQSLPLEFFNENHAGDLISRINNDTDVLRQFFAQALTQSIGNFVLVVGVGVLVVSLNPGLSAFALGPAIVVLIITQILSAWVKRKNKKSLQTLGNMSSEIQESLSHFKVIVACNRLDYFERKFGEVNQENFRASITSGVASNLFTPLYALASTAAQLVTLVYGIHLIQGGNLTLGLLLGFFLYVNNFYNPLKQLASMWSSMQLALAAMDRISDILALDTHMTLVPPQKMKTKQGILEFHNVSFHYTDEKKFILHDANFVLESGKTYALVGPTGGGKTTTASLMARLYDPTGGNILLDGQDIRSYDHDVRAQKIGFILQEPFVFSGTIQENILYGNHEYKDFSEKQLIQLLKKHDLMELLDRFPQGLRTHLSPELDTISLGQRQLVAFMRAVLRQPDVLILDEATANIDTVTEQLLETLLEKLPKKTTRVIIAHRLNTIKNADHIFFINNVQITPAGSMEDALHLLMQEKRGS